MVLTIKRKTSLTLDADLLDCAKALGINVSAVAHARHKQWINQNAKAFAAQAAWHESHGHPLADIMMVQRA